MGKRPQVKRLLRIRRKRRARPSAKPLKRSVWTGAFLPALIDMCVDLRRLGVVDGG